MKPTITAVPDGQGDPKVWDPAVPVTLSATMSDGSTPTFTWTGERLSATTGADVTVAAKGEAGSDTYKVTASTFPNESAEITLSYEAPGGTPPAQPPQDKATLLVFSPWFAVASGLLVVAALAGIGWPLHRVLHKLVDRVTKDEKDLSKLIGGLIGLSLVAIGAIIIVGGLYGGLLEVRGHLRTKKDLEIDKQAKDDKLDVKGGVVDGQGVALIIDAIGRLRGAALILVVGCIPLLAAAWIGHAAVDTPSPTTSTVNTTETSTDSTEGTGTTDTTDGTETTDTTGGTDTTQTTEGPTTTGGGTAGGDADGDATLPPLLFEP